MNTLSDTARTGFYLNKKQLLALQEIFYHYKEFQMELYNYPEPDTLFTKTQLEVFEVFDIE